MTSMISKTRAYNRHKARWLLIVVIAAVAAGGIWGWKTVLERHFIAKRFGVVEQGRIYRSGQISAPLIKKTLLNYSIRAIVDLTGEDSNDIDQQAEKKAAAELGIGIKKYPLRGNGTGDVNNYAGAIIAIADAEKRNLPVLVHCAAGAQRTGGVIAAYRLLVQKKDPAFIISEMKHYGWDPKDNPALLPYLNENMAELAVRLKQAGVIDEFSQPLPKFH
jgi:protein tyrosine/serine phosphatase